MGDEVRKVLVRYISFPAQDRLDSERIYEEIDALKEKLAKIHQEQDANDVQVEKEEEKQMSTEELIDAEYHWADEDFDIPSTSEEEAAELRIAELRKS